MKIGVVTLSLVLFNLRACEISPTAEESFASPEAGVIPDGGVSSDSGPFEIDAGDADASSEPEVRDEQGHLVGFRIEGLGYETATYSGVTDREGMFRYRTGEVVRFHLADITVAAVEGKPELTLFDLAGVEVVTGQRAIDVIREPRYERLTNLAILFESIDVNGDGSDGVTVLPDVTTLFEGGALEFVSTGFAVDGLEPAPFHQGTLTEVMRGAQALFRSPHRVSTEAQALNSLYRSLGISPRIPGVLRSRRYDNPSSISQVIDADSGRLMELTEDSGAIQYTYTSEGRLSTLGGSAVHYSWEITYDEIGNRSRYVQTSSNVERYEYECDGTSRLVARELWNGIEGEGEIYGSWTYTYNEAGLRSEIESWFNGVDTWTNQQSYVYDAAGRPTQYDSGGDGLRYIRSLYRYDDRGNLTRIEVDNWRDGTIEEVTTYEYNADNQVTYYAWDPGVDGVPFRAERTTYDASGRRVRLERYNDGALNYATSYEYDSAENLTRIENSNADGRATSAETFFYDDEGRLTRWENDGFRDGLIDGTPDHIEVYVYDGDEVVVEDFGLAWYTVFHMIEVGWHCAFNGYCQNGGSAMSSMRFARSP